MTYRLSYDPGIEAMHDALAPAAREALSLALMAACEDPIGETEPVGEPEARMRMVHTPTAYALVFINYLTKSVGVIGVIDTGPA